VSATLPERFGENLRKARERSQMTQVELGRLSGVSPTAICRLEAGRREPRLRTLVALAHALDMKASDLIRGIQP